MDAINFDHLIPGLDHFHHYLTHDGLLLAEDAAEFAEEYFNSAIEKYNIGNYEDAYYDLGCAIHLLQDLTVPHHALLWDGILWHTHSDYESYCYNYESMNIISTTQHAGIYSFGSLEGHYNDYTAFGWVDYAAHRSASYEAEMQDVENAYDMFYACSLGGNYIEAAQYYSEYQQLRSTYYPLITVDLLPFATKLTAGFLLFFQQNVNLSPTLNSPADKYVQSGSTGIVINWEISGNCGLDLLYGVKENNLQIVDSGWSNSVITFRFDAPILYPGEISTIEYTCRLVGQTIGDTVKIIVQNTVNLYPTLNSPSDRYVMSGSTGNRIPWIVSNTNGFAVRYNIYRGSTLVKTGYSSSYITYIFTAPRIPLGRLISVYYKCRVYGSSGYVEDTVKVTVANF